MSQDLGTPLVAFAWAFFSVSLVIVALRVWTRVGYLHDRLQIHDWLMVIAIFTELFHTTFLNVAQHVGLGVHITVLEITNPANISKTGHYVLALQSLSIIPSFFGRMSFAAFLLTIIGPAARYARYTLWFFIVTDTLINVICMMETNLQCGATIAANWDTALAATTTCVPSHITTSIGYSQAGWNSITDFVLTIIPITVVWGLNLPSSTKAALVALLTMSSFAFMASVAKAVEIRQLSNGDDFPFNFAILQFCVVVENNIVIIAASMPMLRALWIRSKDGSSGPATSGPAAKSRPATRPTVAASVAGDEERDSSDEGGEKQLLGGIQRTMATVVERTWADDRKSVEYSVQEV